MAVNHSDKAIATLTQMGAIDSTFTHTPIKWVREMRELEAKVYCPSKCSFNGRNWTLNGEVAPRQHSNDATYMAHPTNGWHKAQGHVWANCPTCKGVGKVDGVVNRMVMVGYPLWAEGTKFNSRFGGRFSCNCGLCGKTIIKSNLVPVTANTPDGIVGMWVGCDCAKKILSIKPEANMKQDKYLETSI